MDTDQSDDSGFFDGIFGGFFDGVFGGTSDNETESDDENSRSLFDVAPTPENTDPALNDAREQMAEIAKDAISTVPGTSLVNGFTDVVEGQLPDADDVEQTAVDVSGVTGLLGAVLGFFDAVNDADDIAPDDRTPTSSNDVTSPGSVPDGLPTFDGSMSISVDNSGSYSGSYNEGRQFAAGDENDFIVAVSKAITIAAGGGDDVVIGKSGDDRFLGGAGEDRLLGGKGDDYIHGGVGADRVGGQAGDDTVIGGGGHDFVHGGAGDDFLTGNGGKDNLYAGTGDDTMVGGYGADRFVFENGWGRNRIEDFQNGLDDLVIKSGANRYADLTISGSGGDTVIKAGSTTIILEDIHRSQVDASDFTFI